MANLGELLAELRHDWGLKQEELADILHLSKSTIKPDSVRMALTRARKAAYALLAKE